jgi:hypothetical protein
MAGHDQKLRREQGRPGTLGRAQTNHTPTTPWTLARSPTLNLTLPDFRPTEASARGLPAHRDSLAQPSGRRSPTRKPGTSFRTRSVGRSSWRASCASSAASLRFATKILALLNSSPSAVAPTHSPALPLEHASRWFHLWCLHQRPRSRCFGLGGAGHVAGQDDNHACLRHQELSQKLGAQAWRGPPPHCVRAS